MYLGLCGVVDIASNDSLACRVHKKKPSTGSSYNSELRLDHYTLYFLSNRAGNNMLRLNKH